MALSGGTAAIALAEARRLGVGYESMAQSTNFTIPAKTCVPTGGSGQISVAHAGWDGPISVDFGDGKPPTIVAGPTPASPVVRTSMTAGSYRVSITGIGRRTNAASNVTVT